MASWPTPPVTEPEPGPHRNSGIKFYFTALHHTEPEVSEGIGPSLSRAAAQISLSLSVKNGGN